MYLRSEVEASRYNDFPLKTDWTEYKNEIEIEEFNKRLGAQKKSNFLNLSVLSQATWPKEPTLAEFEGRQFVMFPRTKKNSQSVSIDLYSQKLSEEDGRTYLNRFLSLLSWCDDRSIVLGGGSSGSPVPTPMPKWENGVSVTPQWIFSRTLPSDDDLLQRLAYYREGLNAREAGLVAFSVISFLKVYEIRQASVRGKPNKTKEWIKATFPSVEATIRPEVATRFHEDRQDEAVEQYILKNCRTAVAHAAESHPSDADSSQEIRRLHRAADVIQALARYYLNQERGLSTSRYKC